MAASRLSSVKKAVENLLKNNEISYYFKSFDPKKHSYFDYSKYVKRKMDMDGVVRNLKGAKYRSVEEALNDIRLVFQNAIDYPKTLTRVKMAARRFLLWYESLKRKVMGPPAKEKRTWQSIALDIVAELEVNNITDTVWFLMPVDRGLVPDYYKQISRPMDYQKVKTKLKRGNYSQPQQWIADMNLILDNCRQYNKGQVSFMQIIERVKDAFKKYMKKKKFSQYMANGSSSSSKIMRAKKKKTNVRKPKVSISVDETVDNRVSLLRYILQVLKVSSGISPTIKAALQSVGKRLDAKEFVKVSSFILAVQECWTSSHVRLEKLFDEQLEKYHLFKIKKAIYDIPDNDTKPKKTVSEKPQSSPRQKVQMGSSPSSKKKLPFEKAPLDKKQAEAFLDSLEQNQDFRFFRLPVDEVKDSAPNYYQLIKNPCDFSKVRKRINEDKYSNNARFRDDLIQIGLNAQTYNSRNHPLYPQASKLTNLVHKWFNSCSSSWRKRGSNVGQSKPGNTKLGPRKAKKPKRRPNEPWKPTPDIWMSRAVAREIIEEIIMTPESNAFRYPVDEVKHAAPNYYKQILVPMDLSKALRIVDGEESPVGNALKHSSSGKDRKGQIQAIVVHDTMELIWANCVKYNGPKAALSQIARKLRKQFIISLRAKLRGTPSPQPVKVLQQTPVSVKLEQKQNVLPAAPTISPKPIKAASTPEVRPTVSLEPWETEAFGILSSLRAFTVNEKRIANDFSFPLDPEKDDLPDYNSIISTAMDLETVRSRLASKKYKTFEEFHKETKLVFKNAIKYFKKKGMRDGVISVSAYMLKHELKLLVELALERLEQLTRGPLPDPPWYKKALSVLNSCKGFNVFNQPVNPLNFGLKQYFVLIKKPMDISTLERRLKGALYHRSTREAFAEDAKLMWQNCLAYWDESNQNLWPATSKNILNGIIKNAGELRDYFNKTFLKKRTPKPPKVESRIDLFSVSPPRSTPQIKLDLTDVKETSSIDLFGSSTIKKKDKKKKKKEKHRRSSFESRSDRPSSVNLVDHRMTSKQSNSTHNYHSYNTSHTKQNSTHVRLNSALVRNHPSVALPEKLKVAPFRLPNTFEQSNSKNKLPAPNLKHWASFLANKERQHVNEMDELSTVYGVRPSSMSVVKTSERLNRRGVKMDETAASPATAKSASDERVTQMPLTKTSFKGPITFSLERKKRKRWRSRTSTSSILFDDSSSMNLDSTHRKRKKTLQSRYKQDSSTITLEEYHLKDNIGNENLRNPMDVCSLTSETSIRELYALLQNLLPVDRKSFAMNTIEALSSQLYFSSTKNGSWCRVSASVLGNIPEDASSNIVFNTIKQLRRLSIFIIYPSRGRDLEWLRRRLDVPTVRTLTLGHEDNKWRLFKVQLKREKPVTSREYEWMRQLGAKLRSAMKTLNNSESDFKALMNPAFGEPGLGLVAEKLLDAGVTPESLNWHQQGFYYNVRYLESDGCKIPLVALNLIVDSSTWKKNPGSVEIDEKKFILDTERSILLDELEDASVTIQTALRSNRQLFKPPK